MITDLILTLSFKTASERLSNSFLPGIRTASLQVTVAITLHRGLITSPELSGM